MLSLVSVIHCKYVIVKNSLTIEEKNDEINFSVLIQRNIRQVL